MVSHNAHTLLVDIYAHLSALLHREVTKRLHDQDLFLKVFAVDFRASCDPDLHSREVSPSCGKEHLARGRGGSNADRDRFNCARMRSALLDLAPPLA